MFRATSWMALLAVSAMLPKLVLSAELPVPVDGNSAVIGFEYYARSEDKIGTSSSHSVSHSRFAPEPNSKIVFYIHGFLAQDLDDGEEGGSGSRKMKDEIFEKRPEVDYVVLVDWTRYSNIHWSKYSGVITTKVPKVAASLSNEVERLVDDFSVNPTQVTFMAHSLGSHVSGQAGRILKAKGKEIGLIIADDAKDVISIHTNGRYGLYVDIGSPNHNIYVKSGPAFEKCGNWDHVCQHRAAKGSAAEALSNQGPLNEPSTYKELSKPRQTYDNLVILVLDVSPSMAEHGRIDNLITSCTRFIKSAPLNTFVGIVIFGGYAQVSQTPIKIQIESDRDSLIARLPNRQTQIYSTSIGAGLRSALGVAKPFLSKGACPEFLVVTDGEENHSPYLREVQPEVVKTCVKANTIALGGSADRGLEELSRSTNGVTRTASDLNSLDDLSQSLADAAAAQLEPSQRPIQLPPKPVSLDGPSTKFTIDPGMGKDTKFFISSPSFFDKVSAELMDPFGQTTFSGPKNVDSRSQGLVFNVPEAAPGDWNIQLKSKPGNRRRRRSVLPHKATVFVSALQLDDKPVRLEPRLSSSIIDYSSPVPVSIRAELRKGEEDAIVGADVVAYLISPHGERFNVTLLDNGIGADEIENDGVYSNYLTIPLIASLRYEVSVIATSSTHSKIRNVAESLFSDKAGMDADLPLVYAFERQASAGSLRAINAYKRPLPLPIRDLEARRISHEEAVKLFSDASPEEIYCNLTWTATGDNAEAVTGYEIRGTAYLETNHTFIFNSTHVKFGRIEPRLPGQTESATLKLPVDLINDALQNQNETGNALEVYRTIRAFNNETEYSRDSNLAVLSLDPIEGVNEHSAGLVYFLAVVVLLILFLGVYLLYRKLRNSKA